GARRDRGLAGGLQPAPAAQLARDALPRPVRRHPDREHRADHRGRVTVRGVAGAARAVAIAAPALAPLAPPRRQPRPQAPAVRPPRALPFPASHPPPSHPWWTDKRGPVTYSLTQTRPGPTCLTLNCGSSVRQAEGFAPVAGSDCCEKPAFGALA